MLVLLALGQPGPAQLLAVTAIVSTIVVGEYIAALIVVLVLAGGSALEKYASGRATAELNDLLDRAPQTAHREADGGNLEDIAVADVVAGDVLLVRPAEVVPVDVRLLSASGSFDESAITGESLPAEVVEGGLVLSGSLNGPVAARISATLGASDSQYSRIVALVEEASTSRAPVVRMADSCAVPFTLLALMLADVDWLRSGEAMRFAEVLVVATPCPLLIVAPVAFLGGMSRSARNGVIVKNDGTLDSPSRVKTVVFDKTGTLTQGHPTLENVTLAPGNTGSPNAEQLLVLAGSAEQYSAHFLASSVVTATLARGLEIDRPSDAAEPATDAVLADIGEHAVVVGKRSFVSRSTGPIHEEELSGGRLTIHVGVDSRYAGALIMSDPLRENAVETLASLPTKSR
ncbi:HAD-IC family P-type ATPase [Arthrobacter sp. LAPM80]|uniref:HAD-IC family P-type ATPase n=1 Tax=Arthrobacter sp. LAPM80 TaxID=3141788 RepID=UPI00398B72D1